MTRPQANLLSGIAIGVAIAAWLLRKYDHWIAGVLAAIAIGLWCEARHPSPRPPSRSKKHAPRRRSSPR